MATFDRSASYGLANDFPWDSCIEFSSCFAAAPATWIENVHEQLLCNGGWLSQSETTNEPAEGYDHLLGKLKTAICTLQTLEEGENFSDLEHFLGDTSLKISWLLNKVPHLLETVGMSKVNCQVLSTDGFVSQIVRVIIGDNMGQTSSAIVKMPETRAIRNALIATLGVNKAKVYLADELEDKRILGMMDQFNREIDFYIYNDIRGLRIPAMYYCQKWEERSTGALVMEDLCHLKTVSFFDSLSIPQIEEICSELRIMHNYSRNPSALWRRKFQMPEGLLNLLKGLQPVVEAFVEAFPEMDYLYQKLRHLYSNHDFIDYIMMESHRELGLPDVVCHGDLWTYNFLWYSDDDGNPSDRLGAIIDWQGPHLGSIGEDFAHMLVFCCSSETRRKAERDVLPNHYRKLVGLTHNYPKFTLQNFMRAYRRQFVMHAMHLPFIANVMLKYKNINNDFDRKLYTATLLNRIRSAWEDAWEVLQTELPQWAYEKC